MKEDLSQSQIDDWIAYDMCEPLWPTLINWLRGAFGIESVMEAQPIDQSDEQIAMNALQAFGHFMSEEHRKDFYADIKSYNEQQKREQAEQKAKEWCRLDT